MILTNEEITQLKGINNNLSLKEVTNIYLPLSYILSTCFVSKILSKNKVNYCSIERKIPYIIGITGSVAVGKSTTARVLQILLRRLTQYNNIEVIKTDSFLYSNAFLDKIGLIEKKGFPQTYNNHDLFNIIKMLKLGVDKVKLPIYSHIICDIVKDKSTTICKPDILIIEGLNVLYNKSNRLYLDNNAIISNFIDFSIYIDASEEALEKWYIDRLITLQKSTTIYPKYYAYYYSKYQSNKCVDIYSKIWKNVNLVNLRENILPLREQASLILTKSTNHTIKNISINKSLNKHLYDLKN